MEVHFGSSLALFAGQELDYITEAALEAGLKRSVKEGTISSNNNNVQSHPIEKPTTNIIWIKFNSLEGNQELSTGDPVTCSSCKAILNYKSRVSNEGSLWECEFCGNKNNLATPLDIHEIPTTPNAEYLLEPPAPLKEDQAIIFCLDVSGSMDCRIPGSSMTRLEALRVSMDSQLLEISISKPDVRVGLVIFSSSVVFFNGIDACSEIMVDGADLASVAKMKQISEKCKGLGKIKDTIDTLRNRVLHLRTSGSTALTPALVMSVTVAGEYGSGQVIVCTDGLANVGISPSPSFYESLSSSANQKGVSISTMSFESTNVNLESLAEVAALTGGSVKITDPNKLAKNMGHSIIACGVDVTHLTSKNAVVTPADANTKIGNCVRNQELTTEFIVNSSSQQEVVFQTQVRYTRTADRARLLKVFTAVIPITQTREEAENNANTHALSVYGMRYCAQKAQLGEYTLARLSIFAYFKMMKQICDKKGETELCERFLNDLEILDGEIRFKEREEEKRGIRVAGDRDRDRDRERAGDRNRDRDDRKTNVFHNLKTWTSRNLRRSRSRSPPRQRHRSRSRSPSPPSSSSSFSSSSSSSPSFSSSYSNSRALSRSPSPKRRSVYGRDGDRERDRDYRRGRDERDRDRDNRRGRSKERDSDRDRNDRKRSR